MAPSRSLRSNQKKQTRLELQPLPSSSPAKSRYSDAFQTRLANVRFEGARQRQSATAETDTKSLPTPRRTSPAVADMRGESISWLVDSSPPSLPVQSNTSPLSSLHTSPQLPSRFAHSFNETSSDDDEIIAPSSKRRRLSKTINDFKTDKFKLRTQLSSGSVGSSKIDSELPSTPTRRSSRLANHQPDQHLSNSKDSSQPLVAIDIPTLRIDGSELGSPETSDDDIMVTKPKIKRRQRSQVWEDQDAFVVDDDEIEMITSEDDVNSRSQRRKHKKRTTDTNALEHNGTKDATSGDESVTEQRPSKVRKPAQKHKYSKHRSAQRSRRERDELAEDLLDLQDSASEEVIANSRTRGAPVTTQRDKTRKHLELLKRRRAGERVTPIAQSDDEVDNWHHDQDGTNIDGIGHDKYMEIISDESTAPVEAENSDERPYLEDEDDFVVADQVVTDRLGRPNADIPLQFTAFASAKPRQLFPHIIEWMVKNKLSPAFSRHDDVYSISFTRLDDQVKAQAGSRLISSAWNAAFKHSVLARPEMKVAALPGLDEDLVRTCDACNKSNHPARYDFSLSGKAYSKDTLEQIDNSDDEDDDGDNIDNDNLSRDEQGHVLASTNTHFYLGRFCAANAEMGHKLAHWKHHLNEQVLAYLEEQGVLSADAIIGREKLNKKKREKEAENIVDMMQETGMIDELWQGFQDDLEDARIGMEGHERRGGRSKTRIGSVRVQRENGTVGEWTEGGKYRHIATRLESDSEGE